MCACTIMKLLRSEETCKSPFCTLTVCVPRTELITRLGNRSFPMSCFANQDVSEASTFLNQLPSPSCFLIVTVSGSRARANHHHCGSHRVQKPIPGPPRICPSVRGVERRGPEKVIRCSQYILLSWRPPLESLTCAAVPIMNTTWNPAQTQIPGCCWSRDHTLSSKALHIQDQSRAHRSHVTDHVRLWVAMNVAQHRTVT